MASLGRSEPNGGANYSALGDPLFGRAIAFTVKYTVITTVVLGLVAFGLALITAFSLGLATVLTGIGLLVVYARGFLERLPLGGRVMSRLPILSASGIVSARRRPSP